MNKVILIIISLLVFSCKNHQKMDSEKISQEVVSQEDSVVETKNDCAYLINNFPSNFEEFNRTYGFDDSTGEGELYSKYEEHISEFFNCSEVTNSIKFRKAIKIGINGRWDADAVGLFQHKLIELIKNHPEEALVSLDEISENEASSFWHFLFDGPHPGDKEIVNNYNTLIQLFGENNLQSKLIKQEWIGRTK